MKTKIHLPFEINNKEKKTPIQFEKLLVCNDWANSNNRPDTFDNIALVAKGQGEYLDLMVAWDNKSPEHKCPYLGLWNDGFVEEDE